LLNNLWLSGVGASDDSPFIPLVKAQRLLAVAGAMCLACVPPRAMTRTVGEPAVAIEVSRFGLGGIGFACLPRTGDSTRFEVTVVVDSLGAENGGEMTLVRSVRPAPRPGYTYQMVSVEVQREGQTRVVGTSCWQDAGIVVRGSPSVLSHASIALDAPASVLVRILDDRGRALSDSVWSTFQGRTQRVGWARR
jgi:hypothetical protein